MATRLPLIWRNVLRQLAYEDLINVEEIPQPIRAELLADVEISIGEEGISLRMHGFTKSARWSEDTFSLLIRFLNEYRDDLRVVRINFDAGNRFAEHYAALLNAAQSVGLNKNRTVHIVLPHLDPEVFVPEFTFHYRKVHWLRRPNYTVDVEFINDTAVVMLDAISKPKHVLLSVGRYSSYSQIANVSRVDFRRWASATEYLKFAVTSPRSVQDLQKFIGIADRLETLDLSFHQKAYWGEPFILNLPSVRKLSLTPCAMEKGVSLIAPYLRCFTLYCEGDLPMSWKLDFGALDELVLRNCDSLTIDGLRRFKRLPKWSSLSLEMSDIMRLSDFKTLAKDSLKNLDISRCGRSLNSYSPAFNQAISWLSEVGKLSKITLDLLPVEPRELKRFLKHRLLPLNNRLQRVYLRQRPDGELVDQSLQYDFLTPHDRMAHASELYYITAEEITALTIE